MSADENKKTPDVEAAAAPEQDAAKAAGETKKPAATKAAAKPAAKKPAAKAAPKKAAARPPTSRPPRSRPPRQLRRRPPQDRRQAGRQEACCAKGQSRRQAGRQEGGSRQAGQEGAVERPAKVKAEKKAPPETRHGKLGVATVVDAAGKELETRDLNKNAVRRPGGHQHAAPGRARRAGRAASRHSVVQDARRGLRLHRQAVSPEGHGPRPRRQRQVADAYRRRRHLRPAAAQLRHQDQSQGRAPGSGHGAEQSRRERQCVRGRRSR